MDIGFSMEGDLETNLKQQTRSLGELTRAGKLTSALRFGDKIQQVGFNSRY